VTEALGLAGCDGLCACIEFSSVLLGVKTDNHLTTAEYNWLSTIFYLSYLIFEWPQNLGLQRFPVGKWMAGNILCWSIFLMCHAAW